jgi:hypothetical protein
LTITVICWPFLIRNKLLIIFDENRLGHILGDFFTTTLVTLIAFNAAKCLFSPAKHRNLKTRRKMSCQKWTIFIVKHGKVQSRRSPSWQTKSFTTKNFFWYLLYGVV